MKRCYVTGAAGFLGANLVERLIAQNGHDEIVGIDDLSTGFLFNLDKIKNSQKFTFLNADVKTVSLERCDQIWNLACPASPEKYQRDPINTFKTSIFGADNLAKAAIENAARLFHSSTSEIYGDPKCSPQREDYWGNVNPLGPRSCYDEGKRGAETLLHDYHKHHALDLRMARIFNTYGPKMSPNDGRVVSNLIVQAISGADLTIYGDGTQTRSFCYVDDLIDAIIVLMNNHSVTGEPFNIGNNHEYTVIELCESILSLTKSTSKIRFLPLPLDDPKQRKPDLEKAKRELGWTPKVSLQDGLTETVKYFRHLLSK